MHPNADLTAPSPNHEHRCAKCDPTLDPKGARRPEGHFAVRFGDQHARVFKDGVEIGDCYEVAVTLGTAWRIRLDDGRPHHCECPDRGVCSYLDTGHFEVILPTWDHRAHPIEEGASI